MSRLLLLLLLPLALLSLEGCPTAGAPGAPPATSLQTFTTLYANAVSADDLVVKAGTIALQNGLINPAQARKVLSVTDAVKAALDAANGAAQLGNLGTANGDLAAALGPIAILSACLTVKPLTPATFDSCTAQLTLPTPVTS